MASELAPINSLDTYINTALAPESKERGQSIGAILYDSKRKLVLIQSSLTIQTPATGENRFEDRLRLHYANTPEDFQPGRFIEGAGRILTLDEFSSLQVAQVDLNNVKLTSFPSLRTRPSVSLGISFIDPATHADVTVTMDEESLLRVFTGEQGGIAIFEGMNLPEETALVLEHQRDQNKDGFALFFHPTENTTEGLTSVTGLQQFLSSVNETFKSKAPTPLQERVLAALAIDTARGLVQFDSPIRQELFTSIVIALARLAEKTGDRKYSDSLTHHLHSLRSGPSAILKGVFETEQSRKKKVNTTLDNIIFGSRAPVVRVETPRKKVELRRDGIFKHLQTDKARLLRAEVENYIYNDNPVSRTYLNGLVDMIYDAKTIDNLHDVNVLLGEFIYGSDYYSNLGHTYMYVSSAKVDYELRTLQQSRNGRYGKYIFFRDEAQTKTEMRHKRNGKDLIDEIRQLYDERRAWLLYEATQNMK